MHDIKVEINHVEHDAIHARQVLEQRLKGFETTGAWTSHDLTKEFAKWHAIHGESFWQIFEDQFATMGQCLASMEKAIGELKGLQAQEVEFQTS